MAGTTSSGRDEALQAQINGLGERMENSFLKVERMLDAIEQRMRGLEQREAGCQPLINSRLDAAWKVIDQHTALLDTMQRSIRQTEAAITKLTNTNDILKWILGVFSAILAALLIALATGQARIVFGG